MWGWSERDDLTKVIFVKLEMYYFHMNNGYLLVVAVCRFILWTTDRQLESMGILLYCTFHSRIFISTVILFDQRQTDSDNKKVKYIYGLSFCRLVGKNDSESKVIVTCEFRNNSTVGLSFVVPKWQKDILWMAGYEYMYISTYKCLLYMTVGLSFAV